MTLRDQMRDYLEGKGLHPCEANDAVIHYEGAGRTMAAKDHVDFGHDTEDYPPGFIGTVCADLCRATLEWIDRHQMNLYWARLRFVD